MPGDKLRSRFLGVSTNFANHHHPLRCRIFFKGFQTINKTGATDRIASDTDAGGLSDALQAELIDHLIR